MKKLSYASLFSVMSVVRCPSSKAINITISIASISIAVGQDRRRSLNMRPNQDQLTVLLQRYNLDVRVTCSGRKNCSDINFKRPSKDPWKDVMN